MLMSAARYKTLVASSWPGVIAGIARWVWSTMALLVSILLVLALLVDLLAGTALLQYAGPGMRWQGISMVMLGCFGAIMLWRAGGAMRRVLGWQLRALGALLLLWVSLWLMRYLDLVVTLEVRVKLVVSLLAGLLGLALLGWIGRGVWRVTRLLVRSARWDINAQRVVR